MSRSLRCKNEERFRTAKLIQYKNITSIRRPMVLHYPVGRVQYVCVSDATKPLAKSMEQSEQKNQQQHSPVCSPRECSPRSASGHGEAESSPSPARQCFADAKPSVKFQSAVTGASSSKPPQAAAPQPTHTPFMISDILHSTSSSKNVRHPTATTIISSSHHPAPAAAAYPASYPVSSADDSAYSEGRDSPRSVLSDDVDCKEREGSVGASDSDVERTGERLKSCEM